MALGPPPFPMWPPRTRSERTLQSEEMGGVDSGDAWPTFELLNSRLSAPNPCQPSRRGAQALPIMKKGTCIQGLRTRHARPRNPHLLLTYSLQVTADPCRHGAAVAPGTRVLGFRGPGSRT